MKLLLSVFLFSTTVFASTMDSYSLPMSPINNSFDFSLNTQATRTEYRYETEARTCFRTEIVGYQTICNNQPDRAPVCYSQPIYQNVAYTCYETIRVPYEVFDHQTLSNVKVNFRHHNTENLNADCLVDFTATGDRVDASTSCDEILAIGSSTQQTRIDRYKSHIQEINYDIDLFNREEITAALNGGLRNLHLEGQKLVVDTGDLNQTKRFSIKVFVQRRRFLKSDETLINRALTANEYSYSNGKTIIDLKKLIGGINTSKKHIARVELDVTLPKNGQLLNNNLPPLHQEAQITIWNN